MIDARDYDRIETAIDWVRANFRRQPSVAEMAAAVHLSPHHFSRLFRRWAGLPPNQFLRSITLDAAKQRLESSPNLLEAALDLGLSGSGRLHDLFVDLEAMSPGEYRNGGAGLTVRWGVTDSPFGPCLIAQSARGICALEFLSGAGSPGALLAGRWPAAELEREDADARDLARHIFSGTAQKPFRLHVSGSRFQFQVWRALLRVPSGSVVSYGDLARALGKPGAARAVGQAVGANPVAWMIPCHRVLRGDGALGGYRWGSRRKAVMLAWESGRQASSP
ncbi:MAG: methylated-DNA--[protein]-cysteine S-methyltransferase [Gammaproteobacteria bacterium]|jgi:AraC family transcriptional regulator of adaptative response/methylated-DNA-[protein]-cysteine methyltransferase